MHQHHDCNEILSKVSLALDGALTSDEEKEFLEQLNQCSCCLEKYNIEKSFKLFLQMKVERKPVSQRCIDSLREKLMQLKT
jgi:hypothetical protein